MYVHMYLQTTMELLAFFVAFCYFCVSCNAVKDRITKWDLQLNAEQAPQDRHVCRTFKISKDGYIIGMDFHDVLENVMHVLIYGCAEPLNSNLNETYYCAANPNNENISMVVCKSSGHHIYTWSPGDNVIPFTDKIDSSGATLSLLPLDNDVVKYRLISMGIIKSMEGGSIPANSVFNIDVSCDLDPRLKCGAAVEYVKVHTHTLGAAVSIYRVRNNKWTFIARVDPQQQQEVHRLSQGSVDVKAGDTIAARCLMNNTRDHDVTISYWSTDEMCTVNLVIELDDLNNNIDALCVSPVNFKWEDKWNVPKWVEKDSTTPCHSASALCKVNIK